METTQTVNPWPEVPAASREETDEKPPWAKPDAQPRSSEEDYKLGLWDLDALRSIEETFNLDDLPPEILYYLAKTRKFDDVTAIYVHGEAGTNLEVLTVLDEHNFETMDDIYDVEMDVANIFQTSDLSFRIILNPDSSTVHNPHTVKIYEDSG